MQQTAISGTRNNIITRYLSVRNKTVELSKPLSEADMTIQGADFASPGKWHLAHTTWFFEEFVLRVYSKQTTHAATYRFLFNSYYETIGSRQAQGKRGLITRPSLAEVLSYRKEVDEAVTQLLSNNVDNATMEIIELGLHHEQQHQELFLTDTLYNLAQNPLYPAYLNKAKTAQQCIENASNTVAITEPKMLNFSGGIEQIGHHGNGFCFDNELPQHKVYLEPFKLASHLVTNAQWISFIEDNGYRTPLLWLADGWKTVQAENWQMPHYWLNSEGYESMTLFGLQPIDLSAPVTHISYFEADAYARWAGKRLPTEIEWEVAARNLPVEGNFSHTERYAPQPVPDIARANSLQQMFGDVWEWTSSPYSAYPRFKTSTGAVGEYNGKFMNGQYVLRGGSCVTSLNHVRASYRNFFYPHQRWQFTGLRLAEYN